MRAAGGHGGASGDRTEEQQETGADLKGLIRNVK